MYSVIQNVHDEWSYVFAGQGAGSITAFNIPYEASFINIICIGGGGGGTAGVTGANTVTPRLGGRAGGSGATFCATYPTSILPSTIYIIPGVGGTGGATTGAAGGTGTVSAVSLVPLAASLTCHLAYSTAGLGTAVAAAATTFSTLPFISTTSQTSSAGVVGQVGGGAVPPASSIVILHSSVSGGGGGGNATTGVVSNIGDTIKYANTFAVDTSPYQLLSIGGDLASNTTGGGRMFSITPLALNGGAGGGASFNGVAGAGGRGAPGAGGGGGGGGITFGAGGAGGEGIIILTCW